MHRDHLKMPLSLIDQQKSNGRLWTLWSTQIIGNILFATLPLHRVVIANVLLV